MSRTILSVGVLAVLLSSVGCRMCCHPYDYSGPVYQSQQDGGCQSCVSQRAGSILSGEPETQVPAELAQRQPRERQVASAPMRSNTRSQIQSQAQRPTQRQIQSQARGQSQRQTQSQAQRPMQRQMQSQTQGQGRGQTASFTAVNGKVQAQVQGKVQVGEVPGSEQILSVTDRVVDSSTTTSDSSQVASGSVDESPAVTSSQGWTARRPVTEVLR